MNPMQTAAAMLDLPPVAGRSALRAGLRVLGVHPGGLPVDRRGRDTVLRRLGEHPGTVVFIDIARGATASPPTLLELDAVLPRDATRQRVFLTRLVGGHVSEADRRWVHSLGFADLLPEFDARDCEGGLRTALDAVARLLGLMPLAPAELARCARVLNDERDGETPRATLRSLTGKSAEEVTDLLHRSLEIADRSYHLQGYPKCFVGSEAVAWMARRWHRPAAEAVAIGQALGELGLLFHVAHEHPFLDDHLFYRLARSDAADRLDLDAAFSALHGQNGAALANRSYLGKTYPNCWIGAEAVDRLCAVFEIARHEAWLVLHRLMQFGLIEHVTHSRPMVDGTFFYRFAGLPADWQRS